MAIRKRNLSSPLAVSEFDDDKPKRKSKQKRENRKAVRELRKKTTTRTITRGMSPDGKGGGPNSRVTKPSKSSSGGGKSSTKKKSKGELTATQKKRIARLEKRDEKAEKRNPNFEYNRAKIKKEKIKEKNLKKYKTKKAKAEAKADWDKLSPAQKKEARKTSRSQNKITLFKKKNPQNKKIKVGSGCGPGKLYNKKSCSAKNRDRIN